MDVSQEKTEPMEVVGQNLSNNPADIDSQTHDNADQNKQEDIPNNDSQQPDGQAQSSDNNPAHNISETQKPQPEPQTSTARMPAFEHINEFNSTIPESVIQYFLNISGMQTSDPKIIKLIGVAAQKFIHDIVSDALQHSKLKKKPKDKKNTLTLEDLSAALSQIGIEVRRPQYFN